MEDRTAPPSLYIKEQKAQEGLMYYKGDVRSDNQTRSSIFLEYLLLAAGVMAGQANRLPMVSVCARWCLQHQHPAGEIHDSSHYTARLMRLVYPSVPESTKTTHPIVVQ